MPEQKRPDVASVNGLDVSKDVARVERQYAECLQGLKPSGPITLSGTWDEGQEICLVCHQPFMPGPEGTAVLTVTDTGERLGVVCHACGTALIAPRERAR